MKLFACMCNQPQRLAVALAPVRAALVAQPPISRWGLGYVQSGDVLLVRTPRGSDQPVDLASPLMGDIKTDCAIAHAVRDTSSGGPGGSSGGTDNTPPFRFHRWMFAQAGTPDLDAVTPALLARVPEYLRRNLKGRTAAELLFHVFLARLQDEASLDDPNLPVATQRRALAAALRLVRETAAGAPVHLGDLALTNGRSMLLANLGATLRVRRLTVTTDRGERDEAFRGYVLMSGGEGEPRDGFESVPAHQAVMITRDLQLSFGDLA